MGRSEQPPPPDETADGKEGRVEESVATQVEGEYQMEMTPGGSLGEGKTEIGPKGDTYQRWNELSRHLEKVILQETLHESSVKTVVSLNGNDPLHLQLTKRGSGYLVSLETKDKALRNLLMERRDELKTLFHRKQRTLLRCDIRETEEAPE